MWFSKLFKRKVPKRDSQPTAHPRRATPNPSHASGVKANGTNGLAAPQSATGFDPYNSGAFKRPNAWERVPRL